jgi:hypothetical protein
MSHVVFASRGSASGPYRTWTRPTFRSQMLAYPKFLASCAQKSSFCAHPAAQKTSKLRQHCARRGTRSIFQTYQYWKIAEHSGIRDVRVTPRHDGGHYPHSYWWLAGLGTPPSNALYSQAVSQGPSRRPGGPGLVDDDGPSCPTYGGQPGRHIACPVGEAFAALHVHCQKLRSIPEGGWRADSCRRPALPGVRWNGGGSTRIRGRIFQ